MTIFQALLLGLIQGLTEFLPVSSSGHLVLAPWWLGWEHPGLTFDALLHLGTLLAVLIYFWRDWQQMLAAAWRWLRGQRQQPGQERLLLALVVGSIPAAVIGYSFEDFFAALFETPMAAAGFLLVTGLLLFLAERWRRGGLPLERVRLSDALVIGLAQALAIAPGISRSGATMAAGLWRGLDRPAAARFSFLLGTPAFLGAGLFKLLDLLQAGVDQVEMWPIVAGFLAAALAGFLSIHYLLRYLRQYSLIPFAYYVWAVALLSLLRGALL